MMMMKSAIASSGQRIRQGVIDFLNVLFHGKVRETDVSENVNSDRCIIKGKLVLQHSDGESAASISVQFFSSEITHGEFSCFYEVECIVDAGFEVPSAFVIRNQHKFKFFLESMTLSVLPPGQTVHFECNSWVYPFHLTQKDRVFLANSCCLPNETPNGLVELRKEELNSLRGDGTGERKEWDRIYDYDYYYNDLGCHSRPTLGGADMYPYPRRVGNGVDHAGIHGTCNLDFRIERLGELLDVYVPPDERMSPRKLSELIANAIESAVHFVMPEIKAMSEGESSHFRSFNEINALFKRERNQENEETVVKKLKGLVPDNVFRIIKLAMKESPAKFPPPKIVQANEFAWKDDQEFGRQMLAGINPNVIQCLQSFPPKSRYGVESSIKPYHIENNLHGLTLEEAMKQRRIFILDHHDYLMPFLDRINSSDTCAYASRTLLFLKNDETLKPLAIELSLPGPSPDQEINSVFCPAADGTEAALWQLAKAHVAVNDSGYHQIYNHW